LVVASLLVVAFMLYSKGTNCKEQEISDKIIGKIGNREFAGWILKEVGF